MANQNDIFSKPKIILKGSGKYVLPVFYQGQWIHLTKDFAFEFETKLVRYESKLEITRALNQKHIEIAAAATPAPKLGKKDQALADLKAKRHAAQKTGAKPAPAQVQAPKPKEI